MGKMSLMKIDHHPSFFVHHAFCKILKSSILVILSLLPGFLLAGDPPPTDYSRADTDGPYVFYRGPEIVVKSVIRRDSQALVSARSFRKKSDIQLRSIVAETRDTFYFPLHDFPKSQPDEYELPERMLVISDIEGNFAALKGLLQGANAIDKKFNWNFGKGHLVLVGDFFDRGTQVTECLWLLYKLEAEAEAAGGKVHFIMGNHEIMNLAGQHDYVRRKYFENAELIGEPLYRFYDKNSELGRWLRTKNAVEKIGSYIFCHGGISPELTQGKYKMEEINSLAREYYGFPMAEINHPRAQKVFDYQIGIFWYRKAAKNQSDPETIAATLEFLDAKRMVVGHTLHDDLTAYYRGQLICIDLYHEENIRRGTLKTLYIEEGRCYGLDSSGEKSSVFNIVLAKGQ